MVLKMALVREIFSIGIVTLARQGAISLLTIVLNRTFPLDLAAVPQQPNGEQQTKTQHDRADDTRHPE